jgi:hypothetical protein
MVPEKGEYTTHFGIDESNPCIRSVYGVIITTRRRYDPVGFSLAARRRIACARRSGAATLF